MTIFQPLICHFEPWVETKCGNICHSVRTEKKGVYRKYSVYKTSNRRTSYSGTFIYTLSALAWFLKDFPEIIHFLDNSGRPYDITSNLMKLPKYKGLQFYNLWITWSVAKILKKLYLCTFSIDWIFKKSVILSIIRGVHPISHQTE